MLKYIQMSQWGVEKLRALRRRVLKARAGNLDDDGNEIVNHPKLRNAKIIFNGSNNVLYCEDPDIVIANCALTFNGDNSIIYLSKSRREYKVNIDMHHNSVVYIGKNNYFNGPLSMSTSEQKNIIIGDDCLFSFGCWIRTADPHLVYDTETRKRLNHSRSVLIGDHVWLGQNAMVLKGSRIGSGAIVGAGSIVTGKVLSSNASYGGSPARLIKNGVFFLGDSVHRYTDEHTKKTATYDKDDWIYKHMPAHSLHYDHIEKKLSPLETIESKIDFLKAMLSNEALKNRFFLDAES